MQLTLQLSENMVDGCLAKNEIHCLRRLTSMNKVVGLYEEPSLQKQALDLLPVSEMKRKAKEASEKSRENGQDGVDEKDCLLLEVNKFFGSFFHWQDQPKCSNCSTKTERTGPVPPTAEEQKWLVGVVEGYRCPNCGKNERYPRYNHPGKLLETRYGRCGEHANCQALLLRSMGFEVRHITDWTDHVWVEVYSDAQQRWMKCDGYDNVLEYEKGWGKKLTYVIAVSNEETVDVTWRYSAKHNEVLQRRLIVSEEWLAKTLTMLNAQKQRKLSPKRRQILMERTARELAEFFSGYEGKLLGTAAWRRMLGRPESNHKPYTFTPTDEEISSKRVRVQYCCASDKYFRGSNMEAFLEGWEAGAAAVNSVFRKCEYDWTKVLDYLLSCGLKEANLETLQKGNAFLARLHGEPSGLVSWEMDFTACGLVIDIVTIVTQCVTRESGKVDWKLEGDDKIMQDLTFSSDHESQTTSSLSGCKTLRLTASLRGGKGQLAWQHAQLCSQPIDSEGNCSLDITVTLKDSAA